MFAQLKPRLPLIRTLNASTFTVAEGDGIDPEITIAALRSLPSADPPLNIEPQTIGLKPYWKRS